MFKIEPYSHIYIEKQAKDYLLVKKILNKFKNSKKIEINHYKDVFSRYKNSFRLQKESMKIILAKKENGFSYPIGQFIQNQDKDNFYYSSMILNCLYDCEYCFLQGMHQSAYIVIFVNTDDFFNDIEQKLNKLDSMFVSISYDSDLLALENITGLVALWVEFANKNKNLSLEIRTKSKNFKAISNLESKNIFLNFSLSPEFVVNRFEHKTASLTQRVQALNEAISKNWKVGIVIDPILDVENSFEIYHEFVTFLRNNIDFSKVDSIILGTFRMNSKYLKTMQKTNLHSELLYYPYEVKSKIVSYSSEIKNSLIQNVKNELLKSFNDESKIFISV